MDGPQPSNPDKQKLTPFPHPMEINLADVLFFAMRKNLMLFKDLDNEHVHYSIFIRGPLIDFHKTLEKEHKHIPIVEMELDWQLLIGRIVQEVWANWESIFQTVKIDDPDWADLEVEFVPIQVLMELLSPLMKGARWNVDAGFLQRLETSVSHVKLEEMGNHGFAIGTGSGYLVISNGTECFLFDTVKMSKIIERSFESSIRKIHLKYYTPSSVLWYVKIRLLILIHSVVRYFKKPKPQRISASS